MLDGFSNLWMCLWWCEPFTTMMTPVKVWRICLNDKLVTKIGSNDKISNQRLNCWVTVGWNLWHKEWLLWQMEGLSLSPPKTRSSVGAVKMLHLWLVCVNECEWDWREVTVCDAIGLAWDENLNTVRRLPKEKSLQQKKWRTFLLTEPLGFFSWVFMPKKMQNACILTRQWLENISGSTEPCIWGLWRSCSHWMPSPMIGRQVADEWPMSDRQVAEHWQQVRHDCNEWFHLSRWVASTVSFCFIHWQVCHCRNPVLCPAAKSWAENFMKKI